MDESPRVSQGNTFHASRMTVSRKAAYVCRIYIKTHVATYGGKPMARLDISICPLAALAFKTPFYMTAVHSYSELKCTSNPNVLRQAKPPKLNLPLTCSGSSK